MKPKFIINLADNNSTEFVTRQLTKRGFINYLPKKIDWRDINTFYLKGDWDIGITSNISVKVNNKKHLIWNIKKHNGNKAQIINHFPNPCILTNKINLTETLRERVENYEKFYPKTYILKTNNDKELEAFIKYINSRENFNSFWIVKPSNLFQGMDIKIHSSLDSITSFILENEIKDSTESQESHKSCGEYVIQKYIRNPLLYQGRKFDVRIHILLNEDGSIYIHPLGLVRTTSREYTPELTGNWDYDKFIHITNHSIQKQDSNYEKYEEGNIILLKDFKIGDISIYETFMPKWAAIAKTIIEASKDLLSKGLPENNKKRFYELFGFDFMIDDELNTWLLEINLNPGLGIWENKEASKEVNIMIDDLFNIVLDPLYNIKTKKSNTWIKI